jgi:hypothetical protein
MKLPALKLPKNPLLRGKKGGFLAAIPRRCRAAHERASASCALLIRGGLSE